MSASVNGLAVGMAAAMPDLADLDPDENELLRAVGLLFDAEGVHAIQRAPEFRTVLVGPERRVDGNALRELCRGAAAVYWSLNPLLPAFVQSGRRDHTNEDVLYRRWLLVDCDPVKPAGEKGSATDEEKAAAGQLAREVYHYLVNELGWALPVVTDSGNGFHLLFRVWLPNDEHSRGLVSRCLKALAGRFDNPAARVDVSVCDARRIAKLPGSVVRKGENRAERPWRLAKLLYVPELVEVVPVEKLEALAGRVGEVAKPVEAVEELDPWSLTHGDPSAVAYVRKALEGETAAAAGCTVNRNERLYLAALKLGSFVGAGHLDEGEVRAELEAAGRACGLGTDGDPGEITRAISNGIEAGRVHPRTVPSSSDGKPDGAGKRSGSRRRGGPAAGGAEAADDPFKLARSYLEGFRSDDGLTLAYHRGVWLEWVDSAWREMPEGDLRAKVALFCKAELEEWSKANGGKEVKATRAVVSDMLQALAGLTVLSGRIDDGSWLDAPELAARFPARSVLPARNAIVSLPALIAEGFGPEPVGAEGLARATCKPSPRFFSRYALDYDFDINAGPPVAWLRFLCTLWPDDAESIETLQEWFGYCLTADTSHQKILAVIGPKRSGKGTIARVLRRLVGPSNMAGPTMGSLAGPFGMAPLIGKPLAIVSDARLSNRVDKAAITERLLAISGEDCLTVDRKHTSSVTMQLPTRFVLIANELPALADASRAFASRLIFLRLTESFLGKEDRGLTERLLGELPGILLWALLGWRALQDRGHFRQPQSGAELVEEMEMISSPVSVFLEERCEVGPGLECTTRELFNAWKSWCEGTGRKDPGTEASLGRNLRAFLPKLECKRGKRDGCFIRIYKGLRPDPYQLEVRGNDERE
jgi:P4 family phage/plasmid primase-like protien